MTPSLKSYLAGRWVEGSGDAATLVNPATEEVVANVASDGLDVKGALEHAREDGGPALRAMTFAERGALLRKLADLMHAHRDALIEAGIVNAGNTRSDAKFDVDGAAAVLAAYADLGERLGVKRWLADGAKIPLGSSDRIAGQHVFVPIDGVAVLVNAFNFPAWGMMEKAACAWLAGVPVFAKPATATAWMAHRLAEIVVASGVLPAGAFQFLCGAPGDLLEHAGERDAVAFTGSGSTGAWLRSLANVRERSVRVNVEADSLNAAIVGPDVERGAETWDLFVNDVVRDMTQKAGQKCTAIRRVFVPESLVEAAQDAIASRLGEVKIGDPRVEGVRMGPLASASAAKAVRDALARIERDVQVVFRGEQALMQRPEFAGKGFFQHPVLFSAEPGRDPAAVHEVEAFGPAATLLPYVQGDEAAMLAQVRRGGGGLVASIYTDERGFLKQAVQGIAAHHGRLFLGSKKIAGAAPALGGPGTAHPALQHGGPGRAGGGAELGGEIGLRFYMQRVALQGFGPLLDALME